MKLFRRRSELDHDDLLRRLARLRLQMLVAMATVDHRVPICELDLLHQSVEAFGREAQDRMELEAYLFELLDDPPSIERAEHVAKEHPLAREHARTITNDLLRMALSDGAVQGAEQELLERVRAALQAATVACV